MNNVILNIQSQFKESARIKAEFGDAHAQEIYDMAALMANGLKKGGKLLICGNGGSAADSQHFAAEMVGRLNRERPPIGAIALTTDTSNLTAIGNDYSFDDVFVRQVKALGSKNDVLVMMSTSGNSGNLIKAVASAQEIGMSTVALLGKDGGTLARLVDRSLIVPSHTSQRIQEVHITVIHIWCEIIEDILYPI